MPWNRKTSRRDRKWWSRFLRRNYRAQKRERAIDAENERADRARFKDLGIDHLPLPPKPQFVIELFNLDGFEK